jgi:hypothetical protein
MMTQREAEGKAYAVQQDASANRDRVVMEAEAKARAVAAIAEALKVGGVEASTAVQLTLAKEYVDLGKVEKCGFARGKGFAIFSFVRVCVRVS